MMGHKLPILRENVSTDNYESRTKNRRRILLGCGSF